MLRCENRRKCLLRERQKAQAINTWELEKCISDQSAESSQTTGAACLEAILRVSLRLDLVVCSMHVRYDNTIILLSAIDVPACSGPMRRGGS
jgi:hypothetical protein